MIRKVILVVHCNMNRRRSAAATHLLKGVFEEEMDIDARAHFVLEGRPPEGEEKLVLWRHKESHRSLHVQNLILYLLRYQRSRRRSPKATSIRSVLPRT